MTEKADGFESTSDFGKSTEMLGSVGIRKGKKQGPTSKKSFAAKKGRRRQESSTREAKSALKQKKLIEQRAQTCCNALSQT